MTTVSMGAFLWGLVIALLVGVCLGAAAHQGHHRRVVRKFDRYRTAMLDDWRAAADKVMRIRGVIRHARTLRDVREALVEDDREYPLQGAAR